MKCDAGMVFLKIPTETCKERAVTKRRGRGILWSSAPILGFPATKLKSHKLRAKARDLQMYGPFLEMFIGWSGVLRDFFFDSAPSSAVSCVNL
jgi:hypothetical protein